MDIDDFFGMDLNPTYGDIAANLALLTKEVANLDQDSLIDEVSNIQHHIIGAEATRIQGLMFKAYADTDLDEDELQFLRHMYVIYHCPFVVIVDEPEEDEDEEP